MIALRYQTFRRFITFGAMLLGLSFIAPIFIRVPWVTALSETLVVLVPASGGIAGLAVGILRKLGRLEFVYTEKDRFSYLYNAERQCELRKKAREARRQKDR